MSALAANRSTLCPSTPAAPLFACTFVQASTSVPGAYTLSISEYHLPPLTPLPSADSMRSVHTSASTHAQLRLSFGVSAPCLPSRALPFLPALAWSSRLNLPALPSLGRV